MNKKLLASLLAATLGCGLASAQTPDAASAPTLSKSEAKDAKVTSKAEYKARKKIADANKDLNKAECENASDGMAEHACKKGARAGAKEEKANAQLIHENEKKQIKEETAK